jgi:hypothetical protein
LAPNAEVAVPPQLLLRCEAIRRHGDGTSPIKASKR